MSGLRDNSSNNQLFRQSAYFLETNLLFDEELDRNPIKFSSTASNTYNAATSVIDSINNNRELYSYPQCSPSMDYYQCLSTNDQGATSSFPPRTKTLFSPSLDQSVTSILTSQGNIQIPIDSHVSLKENTDSYFLSSNSEIEKTKGNISLLPDDNDSRKVRGRGRGGSNVKRRQSDSPNSNSENTGGTSNQSTNSRGKHGKALARNPFIPSYMDPNTGPHLCVVCKHNASGFHYRVMACEGCKGFFRRTVQNNLKYTCKFNNNCDIQPHNRAQCQECRWKKCLTVGMAKDLVLNEDARRAKKELIAANRAKRLASSKIQFNESSDSTDRKMDIEFTQVFMLSKEDEDNINAYKMAFEETDPDKAETTLKFQGNRYSQILQCVIDHHVTSLLIRCDILDDTNIQTAKFNYNSIFNFLEIIVEPIIRKVISFAFHLPGFDGLNINDQIVLLKYACFDIITLRHYLNYNVSNQSLRFPTGLLITKDDVTQNKLAEPIHSFSKRISFLNINFTEVSLIATLALLSCDRLGLQDVGKVEALQDDVLLCIDCYLKCKTSDYANRQSEMYATILPELRTTSNWHSQLVINTINSILAEPTVLKSIYNYTGSLFYNSPHLQQQPNTTFIVQGHSFVNALPGSNRITVNHPQQMYGDLKYPQQITYLSQPLNTNIQHVGSNAIVSTNQTIYEASTLSESHLPPISGQSSFTQLLIQASPEMKSNQILISDLSQESAMHANYTPVNSHSDLLTHNSVDPVFDFATDLI